MRTAPASINAMLSSGQGTLARCLKMVLRDGTEVGFTDHDRDLEVAVSNDFYGPLTYQSGYGVIVGDMDLQIGLEADNTEATFPISDLITRAAVLARRWHMADCYIFDVDWTQDAPEPFEMMAGYVSDARPEGNTAVFEIRSQADRWNTTIGHILSPRCNADFGDARCGATPTDYPTQVASVLSNMRFTVDLAGNYADDFFRYGEAEFISGELAATWPFEIIASDGYTQEIEVLAPMPGFPAVGDGVILRDGCSKIKKSDDPTLPTCFTHNNVNRFRGWDQVPGSDHFLRFPVPGNPGV